MSIIPIAIGLGGQVFSGLSASAPSATNLPLGTKAFFSDIGINGSEMVVSASGTWVPHNGRTLLTRLTLPLVKAPTIPADASPTANGAITFGTAVGTAYAKCYCYFAANVVNASQPAGWYYTEMSSTTAAIVYNNVYTPAAGTFPTEPTSKTAFSGAVPGGAGSTAEITAFVFTVKGGLMGSYGKLMYEMTSEQNATTGTKTIRIKNSATTLSIGSTSATTGITLSGFAYTKNIGGTSRQRTKSNINIPTVGSSDVVTTIDTTANFDITVTLQTSSAATDFTILNDFACSIEAA